MFVLNVLMSCTAMTAFCVCVCVCVGRDVFSVHAGVREGGQYQQRSPGARHSHQEQQGNCWRLVSAPLYVRVSQVVSVLMIFVILIHITAHKMFLTFWCSTQTASSGVQQSYIWICVTEFHKSKIQMLKLACRMSFWIVLSKSKSSFQAKI